MTVGRPLNLVNIWENGRLFSAVDSLLVIQMHPKKTLTKSSKTRLSARF